MSKHCRYPDSDSDCPDNDSEDYCFGNSSDLYSLEDNVVYDYGRSTDLYSREDFNNERDNYDYGRSTDLYSREDYDDDAYEDSMNNDAVLETLRLFFERVDKSDNTTVSISEPPITVSNESIIHAHAAEIVRKNRTFVRRLNPRHPDYEAYECDSDDGWS